MNNKGYTLVELLATIVVIAVIMGIATNGVISVIKTSRIKSEKIFVDSLETAIEGYLSVKGSSIEVIDDGTDFIKCRIDIEDIKDQEGNGYTECPEDYKIGSKIYKLNDIELKDLADASNPYRTIKEEDIINPKNKKSCITNGKPKIKLFKDSEYVYYYYMDLSGDNTACDILDEHSIVTNIPENVCKVINGNYTEGKCKLNGQ